MSGKKGEKRIAAMELYLLKKGRISTKELAEIAGVSTGRVRTWKSEDKWDEALKTPKKGGQIGNKNAEGHGAPSGNQNAVTHGAYAKALFGSLSEEDKNEIDGIISSGLKEGIDNLLRGLMAKEKDLLDRIAAEKEKGKDELSIDRVVEMRGPDKVKTNEPGKVIMNTVMKSTPYQRIVKLEEELDKVRGRITKALALSKSHEMDMLHHELDEKKYELLKQKMSGIIEVDDELTVVDNPEEDDT